MADSELETERTRRIAAEALFEAMDSGQFDLDLDAINHLNESVELGSQTLRDQSSD